MSLGHNYHRHYYYVIYIIVNVSVYLPVLIEHAALIMATAHEMRKSRRDQLNPIEVISVVASDGCAAAAAALLFLWPTANIVLVASCIYIFPECLCVSGTALALVDTHL